MILSAGVKDVFGPLGLVVRTSCQSTSSSVTLFTSQLQSENIAIMEVDVVSMVKKIKKEVDVVKTSSRFIGFFDITFAHLQNGPATCKRVSPKTTDLRF